MNFSNLRLYIAYTIFIVYLIIVSIAIYLPIFTDTPPDDFVSGLKLFSNLFSVTVGVALANILKGSVGKNKNSPIKKMLNGSIIFLIIVTAFLVITCGLLAFWPYIRGLPKDGYEALLTLCASFLIGVVSNFFLKGK
jgi:hypothetical protein